MRLHRHLISSGALLLTATGLLCGCRSLFGSSEGDANALPSSTVQQFLKKIADPRTYSITLSRGPAGEAIYAGAFRPQFNALARAEFITDTTSAIPMIEGRVGLNWNCKVMIDTTSPDNWIDLESALANRLAPIGPGGKAVAVTPAHVVDPTEGYACLCPTLYLDQLRFDAVVMYARAARKPLWPLSRAPATQEADIVLGMSALRAFTYVQWDFQSRRVIFSANQPYVPAPERLIAEVPAEGGMRALMVTGRINGEKRPLLLDTAGDFELVMEEPPSGLIRQVSLGDVVFRQVRAGAVGDHGLGAPEFARVGVGLLSKFLITLDNRRNVVIFESPVHPAP